MKKLLENIYKQKKFYFFALIKLSSLIFGLLANILIVRKLSLYDYGIYSSVLIVYGFVTTFAYGWHSSSLIFSGSKEYGKNSTIRYSFWSRNILLSISFPIILIVLLVFNKQIVNYMSFDAIFYLLIWVVISLVEDYLIQYFLVIEKQIVSSIITIFSKLSFLILIYFYVNNVNTLFVITIISHSISFIFLFYVKWNKVGSFRYDKIFFRNVLNFSIWQLIGFSGIYVINYGGAILIKSIMDIESLGLYNVALKLYTSIISFSYVISSFFAPRLSVSFINNETHHIKKFFDYDRRIILSIIFIGHLFLVLLTRVILKFLYGEQFIILTPTFQILLMCSFLTYYGVFMMMYYNIWGKHKNQQIINVIQAVLTILISAIFIPKLGINGAAIGNFLAISITTLYSKIYVGAKLKSYYSEVVLK